MSAQKTVEWLWPRMEQYQSIMNDMNRAMREIN
jgi:hypothetical protein